MKRIRSFPPTSGRSVYILASETPQVIDQVNAEIAAQDIGFHVFYIGRRHIARETFVLVQQVVSRYVDLTALVFEYFFPDRSIQQEIIFNERIRNTAVFQIRAIGLQSNSGPGNPLEISGYLLVHITVITLFADLIRRYVITDIISQRKIEFLADIAAQYGSGTTSQLL